MLQCNLTKSDESTFFVLNVDWVFVRNWVLRYINENAKRSAESILELYIHFPLSFPVKSGASAILLSETVFNSDNLFLHVLKLLQDKSLFKALVTKRNRSSDVQGTIYYCEKPICIRCTVTQLARETVFYSDNLFLHVLKAIAS